MNETVCGGWAVMPASSRHEFEMAADGAVYRAYRHRTDYGWCWWEVTRDGATWRTGGDLNDLGRVARGWEVAR